MPVFRYFAFVGSLLFALLLAADRYLDAPVDSRATIDVDRSIIRIRSARSLPEKIVFDTNAPVVVASVPAAIEEREDPRHVLAILPQDIRALQLVPNPGARIAEQHAPRPHRSLRKPTDRRVAMDRHEFFGGW
jgi:hypothetical protein